MRLNTLKTILGFYWRSLIGKCTPLQHAANSLDDIFNYLPISDVLSTSGQPTAKQFALIRDAGFTTVINLAPHNAENALADEASVLSALRIRYVHIPVDFKQPSAADFDQFVARMQAVSNQKVWVHCAANMRVSAFVYRYRRDVLDDDRQQARNDLQKIWEPFGVWKDFIATEVTQR